MRGPRAPPGWTHFCPSHSFAVTDQPEVLGSGTRTAQLTCTWASADVPGARLSSSSFLLKSLDFAFFCHFGVFSSSQEEEERFVGGASDSAPVLPEVLQRWSLAWWRSSRPQPSSFAFSFIPLPRFFSEHFLCSLSLSQMQTPSFFHSFLSLILTGITPAPCISCPCFSVQVSLRKSFISFFVTDVGRGGARGAQGREEETILSEVSMETVRYRHSRRLGSNERSCLIG